MLTAFYVLILWQLLQGLNSLREGVAWLRMARRQARAPVGSFAPRVALICPCKGGEPGLEENFTALVEFDYPDYKIFFVVARADDPASEVIRRVAAKSRRPVEIVVAGPPRDCGEKVNNLRAAVERAGEDFDVLVFADSDGRPGRAWLRRLVAPLEDPALGATTTFRWYLPGKGFWSELASAWNASIATLLGEQGRNFCWGGGTAIRRATFDEVRALDHWRGCLSDDWALTRALRAARRPIRFVPESLTPTRQHLTARGLLEFTNRQFIITRVYVPRLWAAASAVHLSYSLTLLYVAAVISLAAVRGEAWLHLAGLALLVPLLAAAKGWLRVRAVKALLPEWTAEVARHAGAWILLAPLVSFLYSWNAVVAATTRRITWRSITYKLISPHETRILSS